LEIDQSIYRAALTVGTFYKLFLPLKNDVILG